MVFTDMKSHQADRIENDRRLIASALTNARSLIRALSGPDDAIANACIREIDGALKIAQSHTSEQSDD